MSDPARTFRGVGWQVELDRLPGKRVLRRWQSEDPAGPRCRTVGLGTYGTFGWFAFRTGGRWAAAWTCRDEREACELVDRWLGSRECAGRTWTEVSVEPADNHDLSY